MKLLLDFSYFTQLLRSGRLVLHLSTIFYLTFFVVVNILLIYLTLSNSPLTNKLSTISRSQTFLLIHQVG